MDKIISAIKEGSEQNIVQLRELKKSVSNIEQSINKSTNSIESMHKYNLLRIILLLLALGSFGFVVIYAIHFILSQ